MKYYIVYNPDTEQFDLRDKELCKTIFSSSSRGRCEARLEEIVRESYKPDMEKMYYLMDRMGETLQCIKEWEGQRKGVQDFDLTRALHLHAQMQIALGLPLKY
jgi:hypothetical protein|tara:strand:- start:6448 stop:6756 length:309 start_codon:yes stop_codon:yes gene_type:complete